MIHTETYFVLIHVYGADKWVDPLPGGEEGQLHQAAAGGEDHGEAFLHVL